MSNDKKSQILSESLELLRRARKELVAAGRAEELTDQIEEFFITAYQQDDYQP